MQHQEDRFLREAYKNRDKDTQRRALVRLLELSHSENAESKKFAAAQFKHYFTLFPDLEDDVINAIYDLCEDHVSLVRIQGYQAIAAVSRQDVKWVKRNADVLVQLLQSDEPDEIFYIRKGLDEHLDLAPTVTLGVLCDQITTLDEPMDDEDQSIRDRLRTLVIGFVKERMKRILSIIKDEPGSEPERILANGVLKAILKSGFADTQTIVKDILLCLPSYKYRSPDGEKILLSVLEKTKIVLADELQVAHGEKIGLDLTRSYLTVAGLVAGTASRTLPLLHFYFNFLVGSIHKLTVDTQLFVVDNIGTHLASYSNIDRSVDANTARRDASDLSSTIFKVIADSQTSESASWKACSTLLKVCIDRQKEMPQWKSRELIDDLRRILKMAEEQKDKMEMGYVQDVYDLTRSFLQDHPVKSLSPSTDFVAGSSWRPIKRKYDPDMERPISRQETPPKTSRRDRPAGSSEDVTSRPRSPKMAKTEEREEAQPSLLSRLNPTREQQPNGSGPRYQSPTPNSNTMLSQRTNRRAEIPPRKQGPIQLPDSLPKKPDVPMPVTEDDDKHPVTGFSIKGAARGPIDIYGGGRGRTDALTSRPPQEGESLLDRLNDDKNARKRRNLKGRGY